MDAQLNAAVLACVETSGCNDYDQRSALGMARSWIENQKPVVRNGNCMHLRDDLAEALIEEIRDKDRADSIAALQAARAVINESFLDPTMHGQGAVKAVISKPGGRE